MNILVTAGNTQTPIDQVRCLTNIFTGRTGARIAAAASQRGHTVTLMTSHPAEAPDVPGLKVLAYRTFDDLAGLLETHIPGGSFDTIIHCAAVSDYALAGVFATGTDQTLHDVSAGKVKSSHQELWLRLVPTPKLVDRFREPYGFTGTLVKFKLEVGISEAELLEVADRSRQQSRADFMVANTLEGKDDWALLGPVDGSYARIDRAELNTRLMELVEVRS